MLEKLKPIRSREEGQFLLDWANSVQSVTRLVEYATVSNNPMLMVLAQAGSGKTTDLQNLLIDWHLETEQVGIDEDGNPVYAPVEAELFVPRHELGRQFIGELSDRLDNPNDLDLHMWLGFSAKDEQGDGICINADVASKLLSAGHSMEPLCGICPKRHECPMRTQRNEHHRFRIGAHSLIHFRRGGVAGEQEVAPKAVIIDEDIIETLVPQTTMPVALFLSKMREAADELDRAIANGTRNEASLQLVVDTFAKAFGELQYGDRLTSKHIPLPDDIHRMRLALDRYNAAPSMTPVLENAPGARRAFNNSIASNVDARKVSDALMGIVKAALADENTLPGVRYFEFMSRNLPIPSLDVAQIKLPHENYLSDHNMVLTATGVPRQYQSIWPNMTLYSAPWEQPEKLVAFRVAGPHSNSRLFDRKTPHELTDAAQDVLTALHTLSDDYRGVGFRPGGIDQNREPGPIVDVLFVTIKDLHMQIEELAEEGKITIPDNVAIEHFKALEGSNAYAGVACIYIVGRHYPPTDSLRTRIEALKRGVADMSETRRPVVEHYKDGTSYELTGNPGSNKDKDVDAMLQAIIKSPVEQANRGRAQRRKENHPELHLFVQNEVAMDCEFEERLHMHELTGWHDRLRTLGVVPWIPNADHVREGTDELVAKLLPDVFSTANAVRLHRQRRIKTYGEVEQPQALRDYHDFEKPIAFQIKLNNKRGTWVRLLIDRPREGEVMELLRERFPHLTDQHIKKGYLNSWEKKA